MAQTVPLIPGLDVITMNPSTGHALQAFIGTLAAVPNGTTYGGIFAPNCVLTVIGGVAAGLYLNTGTSASPTFAAISHA